MKTSHVPGAQAGHGFSRSRVELAAALDELQLVHRKEQAMLLRTAGLLLCASERRGRLYVTVPGRLRRNDLRQAEPRNWREACLEEIAVAEADDAEVPQLLRTLSATSLGSWPRPHTLVLASLALDRCHSGLVDLARVWIAEGRPRAGVRILRGLLVEGPFDADRAQILEALALAFESTGEIPESLECYEGALDCPGSEPRVAVAMYSVALRCGDLARTEIAAARLRSLDLSIPGTQTRFRIALGRAIERAAGAKRSLVGGEGMEGRGKRIRRVALEGSGAEAEIARAMFPG